MQRRYLLLGLTGLACPASWVHAAEGPVLLAAWNQGAQQHIGLLRADAERLVPVAQLAVPTRAHGLFAERNGNVLAVTRRPGDWLLRWHPAAGQIQWHWVDDDCRLNGHVELQPDHRLLLTTETDRVTGHGVLGVRDKNTLVKLDEWTTHGIDPHQLLVLPQRCGHWPAGTIMVANGGVSTRPETGRSKQPTGRLDASLVALDPRQGKLLGQWRLEDPNLSIRHLVWNARSGRLGIALQAEHSNDADRKAAPLLAVWDGKRLTVAQDQPPLQGYGGDIIALVQGGFAVSCPRAGILASFTADAVFLEAMDLPMSCALAQAKGRWWNSGENSVLLGDASGIARISNPQAHTADQVGPWQFDNHWLHYAG